MEFRLATSGITLSCRKASKAGRRLVGCPTIDQRSRRQHAIRMRATRKRQMTMMTLVCDEAGDADGNTDGEEPIDDADEDDHDDGDDCNDIGDVRGGASEVEWTCNNSSASGC